MKTILYLIFLLFFFQTAAEAVTQTLAANVSVATSTFANCLNSSDTNAQLSFQGIDTCLGHISSSQPYVKVSEIETSGTNGGMNVVNTWTTRILNTVDNDSAGISSLASNHLTLPAGTYIVYIQSPFWKTSGTQIRLFNITTSASLILGMNAFFINNAASNDQTLPALLIGEFTLISTSALAIQYYATTADSNGLGFANSIGVEVYTVAQFTKVS